MKTPHFKAIVAPVLGLLTLSISFAVGSAGGVGQGPRDLKKNGKADPHFQPPIVTVVKNDFAKAKGWRITWKGGTYTSETANKIQSIFSTVTGAVSSEHYLNHTSAGNTSNADMQLYFGDLRSTAKVSKLIKGTVRKTQFKLSSLNVAQLEDAAKNDPAKFTAIFTLGFGTASEVMENYKSGQIYVFKTDRQPAKYGAVRIVRTNPLTIEVVVQK